MAKSSEKNHLRIYKPQFGNRSSSLDVESNSNSDFRVSDDFTFRLHNINFGNQEQYNLYSKLRSQNKIGVNKSNSLKRDLSLSLNNRTTIPYIIIKEFEPKLIFKWTQHLKLIESTLKNLGRSLRSVVTAGLPGLEEEVNNFINKFVGNDTPPKKTNETSATDALASSFFIDDDNYQGQVLTTPLKMYRSYFNGKYVRDFDLPFYGDTYMTVDGESGWNTHADLGVDLKGFIGTIWKTIKNLNIIDMPELPVWEWDQGGNEEFYQISTEFHLINNNRDNLIRNFWYLLNLIQGPFWVQYGTRALPPNIYSVEVPGVTYLQFAKMHVTVDTIGNKRILPNLAEEMGTSYGSTGLYNKQLADRLDRLDNTFFPDAWKVKVELISMIPNNFNIYMDYMLNGSPQNINVGSPITYGKIGGGYENDRDNI